MKARPLKVNMVTLGCSKNTVDSEFLGGRLKEAGCQVVHEQDATSADAVIINTCGFILDAKENPSKLFFNIASFAKTGASAISL
jgi:ribosomal protein S12 methylthiotransferase